MMQLPEIKQLDIATPIATYYANKRQSERDQLQGEVQRGNMEINRGNLEMNRMKLDEYKAGAPERAKEAEMKRVMEALTMHKGFVEFGKQQLERLDPDAPDFSEQVAKNAGDTASFLRDELGVPQEYVSEVVRMVGSATPDAVRELKMKAGLMSKPGNKPGKFENGQYLTTDEQGNPIAQKVAGYEKPPPSNLATATDIDDYVSRANAESIRATGKPLTPGEQNKAAMEFKRAQAPEVEEVTLAKRGAESATAKQIKQNEELGKQLALIQTTPMLNEAEGKVTPAQTKQNAQRGVASQLKELAGNYVELDTMGGIANIENTSLENISAYAKSSGAGQYVGRMLGTRDQSIRDSINQIKPILIQEIRKATEMGARGMDSEKELQFYLQAATDETKSIQTNMAAISVLDRVFGTGEIAKTLEGKVPSERIRELSDESKKFVEKDQGKPATAEDYLKSIGMQ
jgi:hypothetical protein